MKRQEFKGIERERDVSHEDSLCVSDSNGEILIVMINMKVLP